MERRTAKKGPNAGSEFWGCSTFPQCKGTLPLDSSSGAHQSGFESIPVGWTEPGRRIDYIPAYHSVGAFPGTLGPHLHDDANAVLMRQVISQCVVLSNLDRSRNYDPTEDARFAGDLLLKLLRRGKAPLPTLEVEREALRARNLLESVKEYRGKDGVGWNGWQHGVRAASEMVVAVALTRKAFVLDQNHRSEGDEEFGLLESAAEATFLSEWVPAALGLSAGHWFTPQAPMDVLLRSAGIGEGGARRIDFLFSHPGGRPLAIEIDGPEHADARDVDNARDRVLQDIGIDVVRMSNDEVLRGYGPGLSRIRGICLESFQACEPASDQNVDAASFVVDCATAAKMQFALACAVGNGWLPVGVDWTVEITGAEPWISAGVLDVLNMLTALRRLYGVDVLPRSCAVRIDGRALVVYQPPSGHLVKWRKVTETLPPTADEPRNEFLLRVAVEMDASPFHALSDGAISDFVIRPAFLPVEFSIDDLRVAPQREVPFSTYGRNVCRPLTFFLRQVFRKRKFRPKQGEAVFQVLRRRECVVLLPTGAGKSIIYQLAGLLMPGITLVVDPIVALIDDQVEGLGRYGIDRARGISGRVHRDTLDRTLLKVKRGEYYFVLLTPERLQSKKVRSEISSSMDYSLVNLVVIDEAHCVSEWGHDFRPSYLDLGNIIRDLSTGPDGKPPPLLALTGTASRAVLRDMLTDLDIDKSRSDAVIRLESFDRPEIEFNLVATTPKKDVHADLRQVLGSLPGFFRLPPPEFFRPKGSRTYSGIVFVPTVMGRPHGVRTTKKVVGDYASTRVAVYSGKSPWFKQNEQVWEAEKKRHAEEFKRNRAPVLVATKAFGMGIDKPNIRYTVHFGMPLSLESIYQEAGRAGRDGNKALATLVFSEYDHKRSNALLELDIPEDKARDRYEEASRHVKTRDDITRSLYFHFGSFHGVQDEIDCVAELVTLIDVQTVGKLVEWPYGDKSQKMRREKAIYHLVRVGIISGYEVNFGSKKFVLHVNPFDFCACKEEISKRVSVAKPGAIDNAMTKVAAARGLPVQRCIVALAEVLIRFTYDQIERSRRRAMYEALQLGRAARAAPSAKRDGIIRKRLLDYLQEGFDGGSIDDMLEKEENEGEVELGRWWELLAKMQTAVDAGQMRGLAIRGLESYPDHPGLRLARGASEAMCSGLDIEVCIREIRGAIDSAMDYGLLDSDIEHVLDGMFEFAAKKAVHLGPAMVMALLDLNRSRDDTFLGRVLKRGVGVLRDDRVDTLISGVQLGVTLEVLESAVVGLLESAGSPEAKGLLGGGLWT